MRLFYCDKDDNDFEYEVGGKTLKSAVKRVLRERINVKRDTNEKVEQLLELLVNDYEDYVFIHEAVEEELTEMFEEEAQEKHASDLQCRADDAREYYRDKI